MWIAPLSATAAVGAETTIPLERGLHIVAAINEQGEDYEGLRVIERLDDANLEISLSWSQPDPTSGKPERRAVTRLVRREDLARANRMTSDFHWTDPAAFPGSTAIQTSAAVLEALASGADVPIVFGISLGVDTSMISARKYYRGTLRTVDRSPFPLLLNGRRTAVPALHARGTLALAERSHQADFWWLEQAENPLTLRWTFADEEVQVIRVDMPEPEVRDAMHDPVEAGLAAAGCRAELYGVYFEFASAELLPASDGALGRVADLLDAHGDWLVTVEGHTDSIGSDVANQDLSERRAAAVRSTLIARFGIAESRIEARGFGESRPLESNDTFEGRARNRRVELARDCAGNAQ